MPEVLACRSYRSMRRCCVEVELELPVVTSVPAAMPLS